MTRHIHYPTKILFDVRTMWEDYVHEFRPYEPIRADFIEVMTQVLHAMMNHNTRTVMSFVGGTIPEIERLRDDSFMYDDSRLERLLTATNTLARSIIGQFKSIGFYNSDDTISYIMKRDYGDVVLLERIELPY